jgi:hypothetical protein
MSTPSILKAVRLTHNYLGVFLAPAILFFSFTGFLQTFSLHETTRGSSYKPPALFIKLGQLHKKATLTVPQRKTAPKSDTPKPDQPKPEAAPPAKLSSLPVLSNLPMKFFFGLVAIGLFTSTLTGLYMAWKYARTKLVVTSLFLAGIAVPVLLLFISE